MAVDEDCMAVDEQLEQDGTQEKQEQQKKEEEECEDSEEEDSEDDIEVFEEEEDLEDIYMLLKPFTRKQLYDLSKHAFEKHHHHGDVDDVVYKACRLVAYFCGHIRPPLDPQIYDKEDRTIEECKILDRVNRKEATLQKLLEVFGVWELEGFVRICVNKLPLFAAYVRNQADLNPAHKTILVRSHGFGWDATRESLVSEFVKYGDIADIYYNNHVTHDSPQINCCASILFKRWSSACDALRQQPVVNKIGQQLTIVKKIGNRTTVSRLAPFGVHFCRCLDNNRVQDPELLSWLDTAPRNQARLVPVQVSQDCCWIPWEHSLHGSLGE